MGSNAAALAENGTYEVHVAGVMEDIPYDSGTDSSTGSRKGMLICSEEVFRRLTGEKDYYKKGTSVSRKPHMFSNNSLP